MQSPPPSDPSALYHDDHYRWLEVTLTLLTNQDFQNLDIPHLIQEIQNWMRIKKNELKAHMTNLLVHAIQRKYVKRPTNYAEWEERIFSEQIELADVLDDSPSLEKYVNNIISYCYEDALEIVRNIPDYKHYKFPDENPFSQQCDQLLAVGFWK